MKFSILRSRMLAALDMVMPVVDKKPTMAGLACVRIVAQSDGTVAFSAMSLAAGIRRTETAIEVVRAGTVAVNATDLRERIQKASAEDVTISLAKDATRIAIRSGAMAFSVGIFPLADVPELPVVDDGQQTVDVPAAMVARGIVAMASYAYQGDGRPPQQQIRISAGDGRMMVEAVDGYRVGAYDAGPWDFVGAPTVLSLNGARILAGVAAGHDTVAVGVGAMATFSTETTDAYAAQFGVAFPPVETMQAAFAPTVSVELTRADAIAWVKACLVSGGKTNSMAVVGEGGLLVFKAADSDSDAVADTLVPIAWTGSAGIDGQYLLAGLQTFDGETVTLALSEQKFEGRSAYAFKLSDASKTTVMISGQVL